MIIFLNVNINTPWNCIPYSGSMEPAFYRGDLLFLTNPASERYHTGDITVYKIPGADIPIVHRVMETRDVFISFENSTGSGTVKNR
jgi:signal peptidase